MRKNLTAIILCIAIVVSIVPISASAAVISQDALQSAINSASSGDTITLSEDINLTNEITVSEKTNITINLNGKTITGINGADGEKSHDAAEKNGKTGVGGFVISNSKGIVIRNGAVTAGNGGNGGDGVNYSNGYDAGKAGTAGIPVKITSSTVQIVDCILTGGSGGNAGNTYWGTQASGSDGGYAIYAVSSVVTLNNCTAIGGIGGNGGNGRLTTGAGGNSYGIYISSSTVNINSTNVKSQAAGMGGKETDAWGDNSLIGTYSNGGVSAAIYGTGTVNLNSGTVLGGKSGYMPEEVEVTNTLEYGKWITPQPCYGIVCTTLNMYGGNVMSETPYDGHDAHARSQKNHYSSPSYWTNAADGGCSYAVKADTVNVYGGIITPGKAGTGGSSASNIDAYSGDLMTGRSGQGGIGGFSYGVYAANVTVSGGTIKGGIAGDGGAASYSTRKYSSISTAASAGGNSYAIYASNSYTQSGGTVMAGKGGNGGNSVVHIFSYGEKHAVSAAAGNGGNSYAVWAKTAVINSGIINAGQIGTGGVGGEINDADLTVSEEDGADGIALLVDVTNTCTFTGGTYSGTTSSKYLLEGPAYKFKIKGNCEFSADAGCIIANFTLRQSMVSGTVNVKTYIAATEFAGEYYLFKKEPDKTPPVLSYVLSSNDWTKGTVTVTVSAQDTDIMSEGMHNTPYNWNDGNGWTKVNKMTVDENKTLYVQARDAAGNISATQPIVISKIDKTPPVISQIVPSKSEFTNENIILVVTAADSQSGLAADAYSFNGGSYQSSNKITVTENGTYTVKVKDKVGNESIASSYIVGNIDKDKPLVNSVDSDKSDFTKGNITLTIRASDIGVSGVSKDGYSFDGGTTYSTSQSKTFLSNAENIRVRVKDNAGNESDIFTTVVNNIDKQPPVISDIITDKPLTEWTNENIVATIRATDEGVSGVAAYSFDGGITWQQSQNKEIDSNGSFSCVVRDGAGNVSTPQMIEVTKIDKEVPTLSYSTTVLDEGGIRAYISARDKLSGVDYIETQDGAKYYEDFYINITEPGIHWFYAYDTAGNKSGIMLFLTAEMMNLPEVIMTAEISNKEQIANTIYGKNGWLNDEMYNEYEENRHGIVFEVKVDGANARRFLSGTVTFNGKKYDIHWNDLNGEIVTQSKTVSGFVFIPSNDFKRSMRNAKVTANVKAYTGDDLKTEAAQASDCLLITIDTTPPFIDTVKKQNNKTVVITASDSVSDVRVLKYKVNNGEWTDYTAPISIKNKANITIYTEDLLGNIYEYIENIDFTKNTIQVDDIENLDLAVYSYRTRNMCIWIINGCQSNDDEVPLADLVIG